MARITAEERADSIIAVLFKDVPAMAVEPYRRAIEEALVLHEQAAIHRCVVLVSDHCRWHEEEARAARRAVNFEERDRHEALADGVEECLVLLESQVTQ